MTSMLAAVARAAGLGSEDDDNVSFKPAAPQNPAAVAILLADIASRSNKRLAPAHKAPATPIETAEARAYLANLEALGHRIDTQDRTAILSYGVTWVNSPEVRKEFSSFSVFAAYSRAKARNAVKILGQ